MKKQKKIKRKTKMLSVTIDRDLNDKMDKKSINKSKLAFNLLNNFVENQLLIEKYEIFLKNK